MKKIIFILAIVMLTACEDYLDRMPLNAPSSGTFLTNQTELEMAVAGMYGNLWQNSWHTLPNQMAFDYCTDIAYDRNTGDMQMIGQGAHDSKTPIFKNYWYGYYAGISKANYILENMERAKGAVTPEFFNRVKGEAMFIRALMYLFLTELYGDVPYVTKVLQINEAQKANTPKKEVVESCINDLDEIINGNWLPVDNEPLSGRATKGAALALKCRMALYNEKWTECISAAEEIMKMEGTQYELHNNYHDLFQYAGENSKERIFSVNYSIGTQVNNVYRQFGSRLAMAYSGKKPSYQMADMYECMDGNPIDKSPLYNPKKPYENRDPRLQASIAVSGSRFLGYQFETHGDSLKCWNYRVNPAIRVENIDATHAYATFTGILIRKFASDEDQKDPNNCQLNFPMFRYAEVLLNYAEAKTELNDLASARNALNKVRSRPGVEMPNIISENQEDIRNAVRRERVYELAFEGFRLFDIRRWKIAEHVMNQPVLGRMKKSTPDIAPSINEYGYPSYSGIPIAQPGESADFKLRLVDIRKFNKDRDYLWPIPYIEIETNKAIKQNPGYQ